MKKIYFLLVISFNFLFRDINYTNIINGNIENYEIKNEKIGKMEIENIEKKSELLKKEKNGDLYKIKHWNKYEENVKEDLKNYKMLGI